LICANGVVDDPNEIGNEVLTESAVRTKVEPVVPVKVVLNDAVVSVGEVPNTNEPLPVLSEITLANCAELVAPNDPKLLDNNATVPLASCIVNVLVVFGLIPATVNFIFFDGVVELVKYVFASTKHPPVT